MSILKSLALSDVEAPQNNRNKMSTLDRAKSKFGTQLAIQREAVDAYINGETDYTVPKNSYVTDEYGNRVPTTKRVKLRTWWFELDGKFYVMPKYANKALELQKGKTSIAAGTDLQSVQTTFEKLKEAFDAGELDAVLEKAATDARKKLTKK